MNNNNTNHTEENKNSIKIVSFTICPAQYQCYLCQNNNKLLLVDCPRSIEMCYNCFRSSLVQSTSTVKPLLPRIDIDQSDNDEPMNYNAMVLQPKTSINCNQENSTLLYQIKDTPMVDCSQLPVYSNHAVNSICWSTVESFQETFIMLMLDLFSINPNEKRLILRNPISSRVWMGAIDSLFIPFVKDAKFIALHQDLNADVNDEDEANDVFQKLKQYYIQMQSENVPLSKGGFTFPVSSLGFQFPNFPNTNIVNNNYNISNANIINQNSNALTFPTNISAGFSAFPFTQTTTTFPTSNMFQLPISNIQMPITQQNRQHQFVFPNTNVSIFDASKFGSLHKSVLDEEIPTSYTVEESESNLVEAVDHNHTNNTPQNDSDVDNDDGGASEYNDSEFDDESEDSEDDESDGSHNNRTTTKKPKKTKFSKHKPIKAKKPKKSRVKKNDLNGVVIEMTDEEKLLKQQERRQYYYQTRDPAKNIYPARQGAKPIEDLAMTSFIVDGVTITVPFRCPVIEGMGTLD
jgi:hypothetical protein